MIRSFEQWLTWYGHDSFTRRPTVEIALAIIAAIEALSKLAPKVMADLEQKGELTEAQAVELRGRMEAAFKSPAWTPGLPNLDF